MITEMVFIASAQEILVVVRFIESDGAQLALTPTINAISAAAGKSFDGRRGDGKARPEAGIDIEEHGRRPLARQQAGRTSEHLD